MAYYKCGIERSVRVQVFQDVRTLEAVRKHEFFVIEHLAGGTVGHDTSLIEYDHTRAELHYHFKIMRGDDLRLL